MPESPQITYDEVIYVLGEAMTPVSVDFIFNALVPHPISPAATQEAKNTILNHLQTGQAAGIIGVMDNTHYFLIEPTGDLEDSSDEEVRFDDEDDDAWYTDYDSTDGED